MPNITMLDIEELKQTKLKPLIEQCLEHRAPDPAFHAMMCRNPDQAEAMFVVWSTCFNTGRISHTLNAAPAAGLATAPAAMMPAGVPPALTQQ